MNNLLKNHIIAALLFCSTGLSTYAAPLAQSVFVDRAEVIYPVPADEDVIYSFGKSTKSELPEKHLKFLVWNIHKGGDKTFSIEYLGLAFNRDIVMNQEIFLDKNMMDVFRYLPIFQFTTATSFFTGKEKTRTGVANISPVEPIHTDFVRSETLEPVVQSPKVALINSYPIKNSSKSLTVVNIHGINFVSNQSFKRELDRIYEKIKDIPSPLVFAGDFNTWNKGRMDILKDYAKKLNLSEATFSPDHRMSFNGYPLDHFLHTSDLKVTKARVDEFYQGSDHKPLQVEVDYSPLEL